MPEISIHCPMCESRGLPPTNKKKLNLNTDKQVGFCFRCEFKVGPHNFHLYSTGLGIPIEDVKEQQKTIQLPPEYSRDWNTPLGQEAYTYLQQRYLNKATILGYEIGYMWTKLGKRVVFPIYAQGKLVSWQARDWTNKHEKKYLNAPNTPSDVLYNIDRVRIGGVKVVVLVEGVFDALRIPKYAVALMGKNWNDEKRKHILDLKPKMVIVGLDTDAPAKSSIKKIYTDLGGLVRLERLPLHTKDLGGISPKAARSLDIVLDSINSSL